MTNDDKREQAIEELSSNYPDMQINHNKTIGSLKEKILVISDKKYGCESMKQTCFQNVIYKKCSFQNVALTGSIFRSVSFEETELLGNSFANCDFYDVSINGKNCISYNANNFSQSNFERCSFSDIQFTSSGMLCSLFHNCNFSEVQFKSSTLEGTQFKNCSLQECDMSHVNIEFTYFFNTELEKVRFPFYQFPYIIGAADYIKNPNAMITLRAGEKFIPMSEYREQIDNLILYFEKNQELFPICNLLIAQNKIPEAIQYLVDGITHALSSRDFRMIRYFCQLALHHKIMDSFTRQRILKNIDEFLLLDDIPETQLNYYMIHVGNIRTLLQGGDSGSVSLHFNIKTNVTKENTSGVNYVNTLLNDLNSALASNKDQSGFQVAVANYSPYNIIIDVISVVGSAASIASIIWMTIDAVNKKKNQADLLAIDTDIYRQYIDSRIDTLHDDLLRIQKKYSKKKFNKYIDEVTQQLKTELEDLYSKDIMIFKVKNKKE